MIEVTHFTDPGCPIAFGAEPVRLTLRRLYGDGLRWTDRMVVLSASLQDLAGTSTGRQARSYARWADRTGMPFDTGERARLTPTVHACRAVVAARLCAPERQEALLRRLRVLAMGGGLIGDPDLVATAARQSGLDPAELARWMRDPAVEAALAEDVRLSRAPSPAARALDHKLGGPPGERRYTAPSHVFTRADGTVLDAPGLQPLETLETLVANLEPGMHRRELAGSVEEALEWAGVPLATAEVAMLTGMERDRARSRLERAGAVARPAGTDAWWSLPGRAAGAAAA